MSYKERQDIIKELQKHRKTNVITYINSDRRPFGPAVPSLATKLGTEAQPFLYNVINELGKNQSYDLYLYTSGGQTDSVWPLVSIFREYADEFNVLVQYRAHSAGTLICLGANSIVMGDACELSPVDPSTGNQYNPIDEIDKKTRRAISVEDVTSYFDLVEDPMKKKKIEKDKVQGADLNSAYQALTNVVHPLALGNVNRSHKQIRELSRRLLQLHYEESSQHKIDHIVNELTQGRYSHSDILNRKEATKLFGNKMAKNADDIEQDLMRNLLDQYKESISMLKQFVLSNEMCNNQQADIEVVGAFIESEKTSYIYKSICNVVKRSVLPQGIQVNLQPGQLMPLIPGFPTEMSIEIKEIGWVKNYKGI